MHCGQPLHILIVLSTQATCFGRTDRLQTLSTRYLPRKPNMNKEDKVRGLEL